VTRQLFDMYKVSLPFFRNTTVDIRVEYWYTFVPVRQLHTALCLTVRMYSRFMFTESPSFCITAFSASPANFTALLPESRDSSCYVSRPIPEPSPRLQKHSDLRARDFAHSCFYIILRCLTLSAPKAGDFVELIMLYEICVHAHACIVTKRKILLISIQRSCQQNAESEGSGRYVSWEAPPCFNHRAEHLVIMLVFTFKDFK
jgi:hypothetical protein